VDVRMTQNMKKHGFFCSPFCLWWGSAWNFGLCFCLRGILRYLACTAWSFPGTCWRETKPRATWRVSRRVLTVLSFLPFLVLFAAPAFAHADLETSDPADQEVLIFVPERVVLRFTKAVFLDRTVVEVYDKNGDLIDVGPVSVGDSSSEVRVGLPRDLPDGVYGVRWEVSAPDSHPRTGLFTFTVLSPESETGVTSVPGESSVPEDVPGNVTPEESAPGAGQTEAEIEQARERLFDLLSEGGSGQPYKALEVLSRWVMYVGVLFSVGGVFFLLLVYDGDERDATKIARFLRVLSLMVLFATFFQTITHGVVGSGRGSDALSDWDLLADSIPEKFLWSAIFRAIGAAFLAALASSIVQRITSSFFVAILAASTMLGSFLFVGHTVTATPRVLVLFSTIVHVTAAATWAGGLACLVLVVTSRLGSGQKADRIGLARMADRFALVAGFALGATALAGTALAISSLSSVSDLFAIGFGATLLGKILLVVSIVGMGAYNHFVLVPTLVKGADSSVWARFRRSMILEAGGFVGVVGFTALLVGLSPPG